MNDLIENTLAKNTVLVNSDDEVNKGKENSGKKVKIDENEQRIKCNVYIVLDNDQLIDERTVVNKD